MILKRVGLSVIALNTFLEPQALQFFENFNTLFDLFIKFESIIFKNFLLFLSI